MRKLIVISGFLALAGLSFVLDRQVDSKLRKVGVIIPLEHDHLNEVVSGFTLELGKLLGDRVEIMVKNAHQDANLEKVIVQKMVNDHVDLLVPVTTKSMQLALSTTQQSKILALEAVLDEDSRKTTNPIRYTGVTSGFSPNLMMDLIQEVLPNVKKVTLVTSASDKLFKETMELRKILDERGIQLQKLLVLTPADLYSLSRSIDRDSDAVIVLRDNLVASGISTLITATEALKIPIFSCDEGTVKKGVTFGLGVRATELGKRGAQVAFQILGGTPLSEVAIENFDRFRLFVNRRSILQLQMDQDRARAFLRKHSILSTEF